MLDLLLFGQKTAPDFFWDARGGVLPLGATFTRASSGWFFNSAGVLTQAGSNVARFDYDPATLTPLGYLAEVQSTNNILHSADATFWNDNNHITIATDGTLAPDGSTAQKFTAVAASTGHHYVGQTAGAMGAGNNIGRSIFVKQGTTRYVVVVDASDSAWHSGTFDFQAGAWVGSGENAILQTPRQLANGWWRLGFTGTLTNNVGAIGAGPATGNSGNHVDSDYSAAGTETVYVWGAQVDSAGVGITSYISTVGSAVTRAADVLSLSLTSMPGWNAGKGGVLVSALRLHALGPNASPVAVMMEDNADNNEVGIEAAYGSGQQRGELWSGGTSQARPQGVTAKAPFVRTKIAFGWSTTRAQIANDGNLANTASGTFLLPANLTKMSIGNSIGASQLNGTLESIAYYAGARSDAFVQSVSR